MSFLDRLKREADQQKVQADVVSQERDARSLVYKNEIEPRMKNMVTYLEGLVATLIQVKPPIVVKMPIQGYGDLGAQPFWDYRVEHERRHRSFVVTLNWTLRVDPDRTPVVRAEGATKVRTLTSIFRNCQLGGIKEEKRTATGEISVATFHARGMIKAEMQATISAEDAVLRLVFNNASWLGSSRRQVPWQQIDDALFDRIARFIAREDDSLFTEELPAALRASLRGETDAVDLPKGNSWMDRNVPEPQKPADQTPAPMQASPPAPARPKDPDLEPIAAEIAYTPSMIAAPPPPDAGEMIPIDQTKLDAASFMMRMNVTLSKLRDDEPDGNKSS